MSQVPLIGGDVSPSDHINQTNTAIRELNSRDITELFKDETGVRRVLLGKGANGFYGLKVSKPTFDVYTASGDELAFNSDQNVFKIVTSGNGTIPANSTGNPGAGNFTNSIQSTVLSHGLGYVPAILAFIEINGTYLLLPYTSTTNGATSAAWTTYTLSADDTDINFQSEILAYGAAGSSLAQNVKYYLLQESAN